MTRLSDIAAKSSPDYLMRRIAALEKAVAKLQTARFIDAAASSDFDGNLATGEAGTQGWALGGANNLAIFNELVLRSGIIGDDALTNPLTVAVAKDEGSGISLPNSGGPMVTVATATLALPDGFTNALVIGMGNLSMTNGSSSADFFQGSITVQGIAASVGSQTSGTASVGQQESLTAIGASNLTGLAAGTTITVRLDAMGFANAWPSEVLNASNLVALALFTR